MKLSKLYILRGLSGSGKTTRANELAEKLADELNVSKETILSRICEADHYFERDDGYEFNGKLLPYAHAWCQARAKMLLADRTSIPVIVSNTNLERWEMEDYIVFCETFNFAYEVVDLYDGGQTDEQLSARNLHGLTLDKIKQQRNRYEADWKNGNPVKPWLRK